MWDAKDYLKYSAERSGRLPTCSASAQRSGPLIFDLGLRSRQYDSAFGRRWPSAHVVGVDNSPEMLEYAKPLAIPARLEFVLADIAQWHSDVPIGPSVQQRRLAMVDDMKVAPGLVAVGC